MTQVAINAESSRSIFWPYSPSSISHFKEDIGPHAACHARKTGTRPPTWMKNLSNVSPHVARVRAPPMMGGIPVQKPVLEDTEEGDRLKGSTVPHPHTVSQRDGWSENTWSGNRFGFTLSFSCDRGKGERRQRTANRKAKPFRRSLEFVIIQADRRLMVLTAVYCHQSTKIFIS